MLAAKLAAGAAAGGPCPSAGGKTSRSWRQLCPTTTTPSQSSQLRIAWSQNLCPRTVRRFNKLQERLRRSGLRGLGRAWVVAASSRSWLVTIVSDCMALTECSFRLVELKRATLQLIEHDKTKFASSAKSQYDKAPSSKYAVRLLRYKVKTERNGPHLVSLHHLPLSSPYLSPVLPFVEARVNNNNDKNNGGIVG